MRQRRRIWATGDARPPTAAPPSWFDRRGGRNATGKTRRRERGSGARAETTGCRAGTTDPALGQQSPPRQLAAQAMCAACEPPAAELRRAPRKGRQPPNRQERPHGERAPRAAARRQWERGRGQPEPLRTPEAGGGERVRRGRQYNNAPQHIRRPMESEGGRPTVAAGWPKTRARRSHQRRVRAMRPPTNAQSAPPADAGRGSPPPARRREFSARADARRRPSVELTAEAAAGGRKPGTEPEGSDNECGSPPHRRPQGPPP